MRVAVLFIATLIFSACVSTNSFDALKKKVNEMEDVQKLNTIILAKTVKAVEVNEGDILELAKAANFLFKQLQDAHNQMMIAQAGVMQNNKDLADLDEKVEKLEKKIGQIKKLTIANLQDLGFVSNILLRFDQAAKEFRKAAEKFLKK